MEKKDLVVYYMDVENGICEFYSYEDDYLEYVNKRKSIHDSDKYKSLKLIEINNIRFYEKRGGGDAVFIDRSKSLKGYLIKRELIKDIGNNKVALFVELVNAKDNLLISSLLKGRQSKMLLLS